LINELVSMNLQPEAEVYDNYDNEIKHLGKDMMDIVKKTNHMENDDDFWIDFLKELLSQRAVFVQETDVIKKYFSCNYHRAEKRLLSGLRVFLGDINLPARRFQEQPYICLYTRRSYAEAKTVYGEMDRWKYVKPGNFQGSKDNPFGYRVSALNEDEVEEIHVIDPIANEYDIIINGIPMMEEPAEIPWKIMPGRAYNISMIVIKPLDTDFAYGKQPVASAKFLQGFKDESIRLLIRKFRQAVEPPLGIKKGKIQSKDIWSPGAITQGIGKNDFEILTNHTGVTQSEYNMLDLIEKKTEEFIGAGSLQQGISQSGEQTATEIQQLQMNSIKNLGLLVSAFMRAKRDCTYLRIYNLLENFLNPVKREYNQMSGQLEDIYEKFTINDVMFENGVKGKKVVQFVNKPLTTEEKENIYSYEQREEELGRPIRIRAVNTKILKSIPMFWHVTVNSTPRDGSQLAKVLFKDKLEQGLAIEQASQGQKKVNWEKASDDFENTWGTRDFFQKAPPQNFAQPNPEMAGEADKLMKGVESLKDGSMNQQMTEGLNRSNQKPSLNRMENNIQ